MDWDKEQAFEAHWHGDCVNSYSEETKQLSYAWRMGLRTVEYGGHWPVYDLQGKSVLDIGGGPASILLKTINGKDLVMVDPCPYPQWVRSRYAAKKILWSRVKGEDIGSTSGRYDEVWIYNCLQHVDNPQAIIENARAVAPVLRIFEWIDIPAHEGHPHELKEDLLNEWIGAEGTVEYMTGENGCYGRAYYFSDPC